MANVELVIKVPEELSEYFSKHNCMNDDGWYSNSAKLLNAFRNGTPLPKGHGDLKDFQKIYDDMTKREELARQRVISTPTDSPYYLRYVAQLNERTAFREMLFDALTIIGADKTEETKKIEAEDAIEYCDSEYAER